MSFPQAAVLRQNAGRIGDPWITSQRPLGVQRREPHLRCQAIGGREIAVAGHEDAADNEH
jgi:hypothetical protein